MPEKYKTYYKKNRAKRLAYAAGLYYKRRKEKPGHMLWLAARQRAKRYELEFDITEDDIKDPLVCPILGIEIIPGAPPRSPNLPSLDRIDNDKGYTKDNVQVISYRANTLKSDMTVEEAYLVYGALDRGRPRVLS